MKKDLATSIFAAIIGVLVSYFVCNMFLAAPASVTFPTVGTSASYTLSDPNPEIFNYRAINPTVEVYVGQCVEYNQYGECIENVTQEDIQENDKNEDNGQPIDTEDQDQDQDQDQGQTEDTDNGTTD